PLVKAYSSRVQAELLSLAANVGFKRGLSMHWTKDELVDVLKKMSNFMPANVLASREVHVFPPTKESIMTPTSKSLEFSTNVYFTASAVASEHNEDMVNAEVDRVKACFYGPNDVMVALSAHEKGNGLDPSSVVGEGHVWILGHATHPRLNGFHLGTCSIAGQASVGGITVSPFYGVSVFLYRYPEVKIKYLDIEIEGPSEFGFALGTLLVAFPFLLLLVSSANGLVLIPTDTS
nr:hypothetical protein [Tanacetum cinerariifolium]